MLSADELREKLEQRFVGSGELKDLPIKTRAKRARIMACEALDWPVPKSFPRQAPRFPAENFDIVVQKANNFQVYNRPVNVAQRYAIVLLDKEQSVKEIKVLSGYDISDLVTSDKETTKLQARFKDFAVPKPDVVLHSKDTLVLQEFIRNNAGAGSHPRRVEAMPGTGLMSISQIASALQPLLGSILRDPGFTQERLRGQALQVAVCEALGYDVYADSGQHPDIPNQLLELKLHLSPTIDLGLIDPTSTEPLPEPFPPHLRVADVRYAVFGATKPAPDSVRIDSVHLVSGADFFTAFEPMGGLGRNKKRQIRLPREWFT